MAQDNYDLDYDDSEESSQDGSLPKKLRETIDRLKDENRQLKEQNQQFAAGERKRVISDSLAAKGLNPKIAAFVPGDIGIESVDEWLSEYADVFGGPAPEQAQQAQHESQVAAQRQMAAVEDGALDPSSVDLIARISEAKSLDDLTSILSQS